LQENFGKTYGGVWNCVVGTEVNLAFRLQHMGPTYLHAIFGPIALILYEASQISQADILSMTRGATAEVLSSTASAAMEDLALSTAKAAIAEQKDFAGVAEAVMDALVRGVGGVWRCIVGLDAHLGCWVRYGEEEYLEARFRDFRIVVFKTGNLPQADIIAMAMNEEPQVTTSSVPEGVEPLVLKATRAALGRHRELTAVAEEVKEEVAKVFAGAWQIFVGVDLNFGAAFVPSPEAYLECNFGKLELVLFQAAAGNSGAASIIAAAAHEDAEIIKCTVRDEVRQFAVEKAKSELGRHSDFASLACAVHEDLNKMYGGGWQCLAGLGAHYGCWVSVASGSWIDLKFGDLHMIIFRASRHLSQSEVIDRAQSEQPVVKKTTLAKEQQNRAIQGALRLFGEHFRFGDVAKAIREDFIAEYGGVWHVTVAVAEHAGFSVWPASEGYLNVFFGEVELILFKAYTQWF